jgi:hypothetical protein
MTEKYTLILMLCDKESLKDIERSLDSLLKNSQRADIAILDNSDSVEILEYLHNKMDVIQGYHRIGGHINYSEAFYKTIGFLEKTSYRYFLIVQPGDILPEGHIQRCEEILWQHPTAETLLFSADPALSQFHNKMVVRAEDNEKLYKSFMTDHYGTITQAFIRTNAPYRQCLSPSCIMSIGWSMLFMLCGLKTVIWNTNVPLHQGDLPHNPTYHLMCRYHRIKIFESFGLREVYRRLAEYRMEDELQALAEYTRKLASQLEDAGREHEAQNCHLLALVAWEHTH